MVSVLSRPPRLPCLKLIHRKYCLGRYGRADLFVRYWTVRTYLYGHYIRDGRKLRAHALALLKNSRIKPLYLLVSTLMCYSSLGVYFCISRNSNYCVIITEIFFAYNPCESKKNVWGELKYILGVTARKLGRHRGLNSIDGSEL